MRKIILLVALLLSVSSFAEYREDFEGTIGSALPDGWSQVSNASDGGFITTTDYSSTYFNIPAHTRYVGTNDDLCNCDKSGEKLISSAYVVPAGSSELSFEYVLGAYEGESANVGISTDGGATVSDLGTLAATGNNADHVWRDWAADISAFAGQTINIVWSYSDNGGWGAGFMLDDVKVFTPPNVEMEMTSLGIAPVVVAGNVTIEGIVTNNGLENIASIDIVWDDGGTPNSQTFPVNLNQGETFNFSHSTPLQAAPGVNYDINVCVDAVDDVDESNDCSTTSVSTVSTLVPKISVGELRTGEWGGWNPRGTVALAEMAISNPDDFIGIAVHNSDPMQVASYDGEIGDYLQSAFPTSGLDRVLNGDPTTFPSMLAARSSMIPPASVSASATVSGNTISVKATADFVGSISGDHRLAVVLLEDNVSGAGQANYYSGGGVGVLQNPDGGSMPNFDWGAAPSTVNPVYHDHVARALGDDEIKGVAGSLSASITAGDSESHTYEFTIDPVWKLEDMRFVAMLVNGSTGEILNAGMGSFVCPADEFGGPYPVGEYDPAHPCELCSTNSDIGAKWEPFTTGSACPNLMYSDGFEDSP